MKLYKAIIWIGDYKPGDRVATEDAKAARAKIFETGKRVTVLAESLQDARDKLEAEYGMSRTVYEACTTRRMLRSHDRPCTWIGLELL